MLAMKSHAKKEKNKIVTHKNTSDIKKIKQENRRKRREAIREQVVVLQQGRMTYRVIEQEGNQLKLVHD